MKVVFRVDASYWIGSGHVMRCLVLAESLQLAGWQVTFACLPQTGDMIEHITKYGFPVVRLSPPVSLLTPRYDGDYSSWLQRSEKGDADDFVKHVPDTDWVVVDHYGINAEWESNVKRSLSCNVLAIDDLNRRHHCDVILDQNLWPNLSDRYSGTDAIRLLGPQYALLNKKFALLKQNPPTKQNQVIAFFGGSDPTRECYKLLQAINRFKTLPFAVKLVIGKNNQDATKLKGHTQSNKVEVVDFIDDFATELAISRYALGASGTSNWERFCLNLPASVVSVADNQWELSNYLAERGLIHSLGDGKYTSTKTYEEELERLCSIWPSLTPFTAIDIDGKGADRVVSIMEKNAK